MARLGAEPPGPAAVERGPVLDASCSLELVVKCLTVSVNLQFGVKELPCDPPQGGQQLLNLRYIGPAVLDQDRGFRIEMRDRVAERGPDSIDHGREFLPSVRR